MAVVESRPRPLMHAHACIGGMTRPLLVVCEIILVASQWPGMGCVLSRYAVLVGPGLGRPCDGVARSHDCVISDGIIAVIVLHLLPPSNDKG